MISVRQLSKSFGEKTLFTDLSFDVAPGERLSISAPSGVGKTTLLRILCGLEKADTGTVEGLSPQSVSYLFQEPRLFPSLTVLENVLCIHPDPREAEEKCRKLLGQLGLSDALSQYPHELSGGMKQRVALARTLSSDRPVVFLDEPFTALDEELRESVRALVQEYCKDKTLLFISHDPKDSEILTQRTLYL